MGEKKRYVVEFTADAKIEVDNSVIERALTQEWRETYYEFDTPEKVVEHIAYNMAINHLRLSQLDGFADLKDDLAVMSDGPNWAIIPNETDD